MALDVTSVQKFADSCQWLGENGAAEATLILVFLDSIGIKFSTGEIGDSVLGSMTVRDGKIIVDPAIPAWPGDLLHDAGHLAMTEPALRHDLHTVPDDPAEEMGAMAWSVAAATEIGIPLETVFHQAGYKGGAQNMIDSFRAAPSIGVPFLAWLGMTAEPRRAAEWGIPAFPVMQRWLR
jgi:hypothetical protein